jgi:putative ABC transport system permease protein
MLWRDRLHEGVAGLRRQRLRAALTLLGVVLGTATLSISAAVGMGIVRAIDSEFQKLEQIRVVRAFPNFNAPPTDDSAVPEEAKAVEGAMSDARRERIRRGLIEAYKRKTNTLAPTPISPEVVERLRAIPHVVQVRPASGGSGFLRLGQTLAPVSFAPLRPGHPRLPARLVAGRDLSGAPGEALVSEFALYRLGLKDEAAAEAVVGTELALDAKATAGGSAALNFLGVSEADVGTLTEGEAGTLEAVQARLRDALGKLDLSPEQKLALAGLLARKKSDAPKLEPIRRGVRVVGVYRFAQPDEPKPRRDFDPLPEADLLLAEELSEGIAAETQTVKERGYASADVVVDADANLRGVVEEVKRLGLREFSFGLAVENFRQSVSMIGLVMDFVALVALVVAAVGIANTLLTSVLERTREIGVLKAVGARDGQILGLFLLEGGLIGLVGGLSGIASAYLISLPADAIAKSILVARVPDAVVPESFFHFPWWLLVGVPAAAFLLTTVAAAWPARRAARIRPVDALRYE